MSYSVRGEDVLTLHELALLCRAYEEAGLEGDELGALLWGEDPDEGLLEAQLRQLAVAADDDEVVAAVALALAPFSGETDDEKIARQGRLETELKHGSPDRPGYRLLHPRTDVDFIGRLVAKNPRLPGEELFKYQSRLVDKLSPEERHEILARIRERYLPVGYVVEAAEQWRRDRGLPQPRILWDDVECDLRKGRRVAEAYSKLRDRPDDPEVRAAYDDFKRQNQEQWDLLTRPESEGGLGVTVEFVEGEPYPSATAQADDVRQNRHLRVENDLGAGHPLMTTEEYNRFRAVHDAFGHTVTGFGFDRHGEYVAWLQHNTMYSDPGRKAMSTEYHGSNSALWNNVETRAVADLLPDELIQNPWDEEGNWVRKAARVDPLAELIETLGLDADFANRYDNRFEDTGTLHAAAMSLDLREDRSETKHGEPGRPGYRQLHPGASRVGVRWGGPLLRGVPEPLVRPEALTPPKFSPLRSAGVESTSKTVWVRSEEGQRILLKKGAILDSEAIREKMGERFKRQMGLLTPRTRLGSKDYMPEGVRAPALVGRATGEFFPGRWVAVEHLQDHPDVVETGRKVLGVGAVVEESDYGRFDLQSLTDVATAAYAMMDVDLHDNNWMAVERPDGKLEAVSIDHSLAFQRVPDYASPGRQAGDAKNFLYSNPAYAQGKIPLIFGEFPTEDVEAAFRRSFEKVQRVDPSTLAEDIEPDPSARESHSVKLVGDDVRARISYLAEADDQYVSDVVAVARKHLTDSQKMQALLRDLGMNS